MIEHDEVMNSCNARAEQVGPAALTDIEQVVVLVNTVHFEVVMGGLSQFYYNSAGNQAVETVPALEAVGAFKSAEALRGANALFPGGAPSPDRGVRYDGLQALVDSGLLNPLTTSFYEEDQFDYLCSYIDAHADELREHCPG